MLTPDLVRARLSQGELQLTQFSAKTKARALVLAAEYLLLARAHIGTTRDAFKQACNLVAVIPAERRLADGILRLVEDACDFGAKVTLDPLELRREVFRESTHRRQSASVERPFERAEVLETVAARHGVSCADVEVALYADLKGAQKLTAVAELTPDSLVESYQLGQVQAVLLRAVNVVADVHFASPIAYRQLFNKLKFRRLLYQIERTTRGYRVRLDGPFSLFESVTKYGLQLALVLPALLECEELKLKAELRWGKQRKNVKFAFEHHGKSLHHAAGQLPDEVERLRASLLEKRTAWEITTCTDILDLPGVGVCIPDLAFSRGKQRVYLEVLGYWSRDAVWRRVELAQQGLREKVLYAVSTRLRVSETVLEASDNAALYVYKGVMSPTQVLKHVEALAAAKKQR